MSSSTPSSPSPSSSSSPPLHLELRHINGKYKRHIISLLDAHDDWKTLASIIPNPDGQSGLLFSQSKIRILDNQKQVLNGSPSEALLDYWATVGRKRATLEDLMSLLEKAELFRVHDFISIELLKQNSVPRLQTQWSDNDKDSRSLTAEQPSAPLLSNEIQHTSTTINNDLTLTNVPRHHNATAVTNHLNCTDNQFVSIENNNLVDKFSASLKDNLVFFKYSDLESATNHFSDIPFSEGGSKLGEGAFGAVFYANIQSYQEVAVKKLKNDVDKQSLNEVQIMQNLQHNNLLNIYGISFDGPSLCLLYEYMPNGSLLDRLACLHGTPPIQWELRLDICHNISQGLVYLHSQPLIHRDIKSANILLDKNFTPKIGDFGLTRLTLGEAGMSAVTANIIGTTCYMAPEAFRGDISIKLDTFSFGVVLIELLTGWPPYDENRSEPDILSYFEESLNDNIDVLDRDSQILDTKAGKWDLEVAQQLIKLSQLAIEQKKKLRPTMTQILVYLNEIKDHNKFSKE